MKLNMKYIKYIKYVLSIRKLSWIYIRLKNVIRSYKYVNTNYLI